MANKEAFYEIAGIPVVLRGQEDHLFTDEGVLTGFRTAPREHGYEYRVEVLDSLPTVDGALCYSDEACCVLRSGSEVVTCFGGDRPGREGVYAMSRRTPRGSRIIYRRTPFLQRVSPKQALRCMELPHLLAVNGGILLHCAWIRWKDAAILFTAPSGTGKSTQARLWCEYMGAELINGDRSALRILDDQVFACGIPMSGSSEVRKNETMPLRAIVYLSQAPENRIQRLGGVRAFRRLWEGCTVPVWDRRDMELSADTLSGVVSRVGVYHLSCRPDREAVALLADTLEVI